MTSSERTHRAHSMFCLHVNEFWMFKALTSFGFFDFSFFYLSLRNIIKMSAKIRPQTVVKICSYNYIILCISSSSFPASWTVQSAKTLPVEWVWGTKQSNVSCVGWQTTINIHVTKQAVTATLKKKELVLFTGFVLNSPLEKTLFCKVYYCLWPYFNTFYSALCFCPIRTHVIDSCHGNNSE